MARLIYAETFHVEPQRVNPPVRWWYRWQTWLAAENSAAAHARAGRSDNWARDLTQDDIRNMKWADDG